MSDFDRGDQAIRFAHLRPLQRCYCGKPATEALYSGLNALYGYYCSKHAGKALREFKATGRAG